ncbi:MAG: hypothetical protein K2H56_00875 [Malacoplasma sp.]|nr:hypothetical protein [Malacoplasma sp.]MDE7100048.1 hypothetical protein [Malacoplasma sp.]
MGISVNQVIDNREIAIKGLKKIKSSFINYLFFALFALLILITAIAVYSAFLITYKLYEISFFVYFIYPIVIFFWLAIFGLIAYFFATSIKSKIEFLEISNIFLSKREINKIFNPFWLLNKITKIHMIIKNLKKQRPDPQFIIDLID